jgi:uncharacterized spore protein YtfJ
VKIEPVSFLVIREGNVRLISANAGAQNSVEKLLDAMPDIIDKVKEVLPKKNEEEDTED